jgi:maltose alpha-D-glucosyltransferase/alpha-amylase
MMKAGELLPSIHVSRPVDAVWTSQASSRTTLEREVLPKHLARTRWYPERAANVIRPKVTSAIPFGKESGLPWLIFFETTKNGLSTRYVMPMQVEWGLFDHERYNLRTLAILHQGERRGALLDVATDPTFVGLLLRNLSESLNVEESDLRLEFRPTRKFSDSCIKQPENIRAVQAEQSNSTALVDSDYVVKVYRKLEAGINPEIEMGRFLTEIAGFTNTPALLGSVELVEENTRSAVAIVHAFVANQGDAWAVTSADLDRFVAGQRLLSPSEYTTDSAGQAPCMQYMAQIGKRVAEMHVALASASEHTDFAPEIIQSADVKQWLEDTNARAEHVFNALEQQRGAVKEVDRPLLERALAQRAVLNERLKAFLPLNSEGLKIRHHGDLHLGQILIVPDDIFIIDFEGEPRRPINERRRKAPAARDVAGVIRSIDYACTAALQRARKLEPDYYGKLGSGLLDWRGRGTAAFLTAYREVATKISLWPADPKAADHMLNYFLLEKVLYEIEYELAHRPDWLGVPLTGFLDILSYRSNEAS